MSDEATPGEGGNETAVAVSESSVAEIVDSLGGNTPWSSADTTETAPPATQSAAAETGKGKEPSTKTEPPPLAKVQFFSDEELGKLTPREVANPSFDWSKVPPAWQNVLKGWQGDITRFNQILSRAKQSERSPKTPQPTEEAEDPQTATNRSIVADAMKSLGIDPSIVAEMTEDAVRTKGIALAVQTVPEYLTNEAFNEAVNLAIVQDDTLAGLADSENPQDIAIAIQTAAYRVQRDGLAGQVKSFQDREAGIAAKESELASKIAEVEQERTKLNRAKTTVAGGSSQGKPPAPKSKEPGVSEIVDELGLFNSGPLRVS